LRLFESEDALERELEAFTVLHRQHLGMVSADVPLISNLDVWINIALIQQYQRNLPPATAREDALLYLRRYQLEMIAGKRNPALTDEQRFLVMLLRAAMVKEAFIVIDRPFKLLPEMQDSRFIFDSLKIIDDLYKECYIFDYVWFKDRYRMSDAA
jgi:ABC-type lipoprotein export system ATPase subunit